MTAPKLRRSKSLVDVRTARDPLRGVKRPISKTDILPSKRLLKPGMSSAISKASCFQFKQATNDKKIAAIANVMKSSDLADVARVTQKPNFAPRPLAKSKVNEKPQTKVPPRSTFKPPVASKITTASSAAVKQAASKPTMKPAPYDYKARFTLLKEKFDTLKADSDAQKQTIEEFDENFAQTQQQVQEYESNISELQDALQEKIDENATVQKDNTALKQQVSNLSTKNKALTASLAEQSEELQEAKVKIERLEKIASQVEHIRAHNVELEQQVKESEMQLQLSRSHLFTINSERMALHNMVLDLRGNIRVFARVRPPLASEADRTLCTWSFLDESSLEIGSNEIVGQKKPAKHEFAFDQVFDPNTTQSEIFEIVAPLVQSALDGYNVCIFAYGQTGSGKTYTMDGASGNPGIIPRTVELLFKAMDEASILGWKYTVSAFFLEIYNEVLYDLLDNVSKDVEIRMASAKSKTDIYVSNISIIEVKTARELYDLMEVSRSNRATAATIGNERSSRSHAVTKIEIVGKHPDKDEKLVGTINLVDLAGSESPKNSTRMDETKNINRSLSELSNVILSLVQKNEHVPYRNSKLTHLLMPSLSGNSKTLMFVNVSPLQDNFNESVKSLRFASQVNSCKLAKAKKNKQSALMSSCNISN